MSVDTNPPVGRRRRPVLYKFADGDAYIRACVDARRAPECRKFYSGRPCACASCDLARRTAAAAEFLARVAADLAGHGLRPTKRPADSRDCPGMVFWGVAEAPAALLAALVDRIGDWTGAAIVHAWPYYPTPLAAWLALLDAATDLYDAKAAPPGLPVGFDPDAARAYATRQKDPPAWRWYVRPPALAPNGRSSVVPPAVFEKLAGDHPGAVELFRAYASAADAYADLRAACAALTGKAAPVRDVVLWPGRAPYQFVTAWEWFRSAAHPDAMPVGPANVCAVPVPVWDLIATHPGASVEEPYVKFPTRATAEAAYAHAVDVLTKAGRVITTTPTPPAAPVELPARRVRPLRFPDDRWQLRALAAGESPPPGVSNALTREEFERGGLTADTATMSTEEGIAGKLVDCLCPVAGRRPGVSRRCGRDGQYFWYVTAGDIRDMPNYLPEAFNAHLGGVKNRPDARCHYFPDRVTALYALADACLALAAAGTPATPPTPTPPDPPKPEEVPVPTPDPVPTPPAAAVKATETEKAAPTPVRLPPVRRPRLYPGAGVAGDLWGWEPAGSCGTTDAYRLPKEVFDLLAHAWAGTGRPAYYASKDGAYNALLDALAGAPGGVGVVPAPVPPVEVKAEVVGDLQIATGRAVGKSRHAGGLWEWEPAGSFVRTDGDVTVTSGKAITLTAAYGSELGGKAAPDPLRAVLADPYDPDARLAYANFLLLQGPSPRAAYIRACVDARRAPECRKFYSGRPCACASCDLARRTAAGEFDGVFTALRRLCPAATEFDTGFPSVVRMAGNTPSAYRAAYAAVAAHPIVRVDFAPEVEAKVFRPAADGTIAVNCMDWPYAVWSPAVPPGSARGVFWGYPTLGDARAAFSAAVVAVGRAAAGLPPLKRPAKEVP